MKHVIVDGGIAVKFFQKSVTQEEAKIGHDEFEHYKSVAKTVALAVEQQLPD